ncbi:MAG: hypothetical protein IJ722_04925 [Alloprevotella sp.]|nr:hypothetical protein [Alloprevotella sp.]
MKNETKLGGVLSAAVGTAEAAAPAEGTKKYVPPTMEVIPLGPQRLLATSGAVSGPPVPVTITPIGVDYYAQLLAGSGQGWCIGAKGWDFECRDLGSSFMSRYAASVGLMQAYLDSRTDCPNFGYGPALSCGPGTLMAPSSMPEISFGGGVAWTAAEFFSGAQFDACSDGTTFSGTYDGRRFEGMITGMEFIDGDPDDQCRPPNVVDFSNI